MLHQFLEFTEFTRKLNGIKHKFVSPYHQASNGQAESAVKTVKSGLRRMSGETLETKLSWFLLSYRTTPHTTTEELLMKRKLQTNLDRLRRYTFTTVLLSQDHQNIHHDRTAKMWIFHKGQEVFAQNFNNSPEWLAGHLLEGIDALSFLIRLQDGRVIQQDYMRAHLCSSELMSLTPVNNPGPEQIESRLPPQLNTAPQVPIHTPDIVMPENPPVQKSTFAMSTPL